MYIGCVQGEWYQRATLNKSLNHPMALEFESYLSDLRYGGNVKKAHGLGPHNYCVQCGEPHDKPSSKGEMKLCKECASTVNKGVQTQMKVGE